VERRDSSRGSLTQAAASASSLCILGCRVDRVDAGAAVARIEQQIAQGTPAQVVTLGAEMANLAHDDDRYREVLNSAALVVPDTIGIVLASRWIGTPLPERVAGIDLIERLCALAAQRGLPIFLLGGAPGIASAAGLALEQRHPGLVIAGVESGYFRDEASGPVIERIRNSGARLVLVGLGFPRQEYWIHDHLAELGPAVCIGVGGSFDVISGRLARAPLAVRRVGLEWLYRLLHEPRRLWRRYARYNPRFVVSFARQYARHRASR